MNGTGMRAVALLIGALLLGGGKTARADGVGTSNADTLVYGWIYHYAVSEGSGVWVRVPFEDGVGACVFEYNSTSPYRGALRYIDYDDRTCTWYVYGMNGADCLYKPDLFDGGATVCNWVTGQVGGLKSEVVLPPLYNDCLDVHGDTGSISTGDGDHIWSYESGQIYGDGGSDYIYGSDYGDTLEGDYGDDVIYGGEGDDVLKGWENDDYLVGGDGNDTLYGGTGTDDSCSGGAGTDTCSTGSPYYCEYESCENP